jgi:GTPase SAR1 family protein
MEFVFWTVGGGLSQKIRPLYRSFYKNADAIMFIIDSGDCEKIDEAKIDIDRISKDPTVVENQPVVLFIANKCDLLPSITIEELSRTIEFENIPCVHKKIMRCCALTGEGLFECFDWVGAECYARRRRKSLLYSLASYMWGGSTGSNSYIHQQKQERADPALPQQCQRTTTVDTKEDHQKGVEKILSNEDTSILSVAALSEDCSDTELLFAFESITLPLAVWTHRNRLRIVWLFLRAYGMDGAQRPLFLAWDAYKTALGHGNYFHETLTYFWMHMIAAATATCWKNHMNDSKLRHGEECSFDGSATEEHNTFRLYSGSQTEEGELLWNDLTFAAFYSSETSQHLQSGQLFRLYYSHELILLDEHSRSCIVSPDLQPLPILPYTDV